MKILWAKSDFLHPTTKGGHIRTLEMLRCLRRQHEIHYVAFSGPEREESLRRCGEYCTNAYPVEHIVPPHTSPAFAWQLVRGLVSPLPVAVSRYRSEAMRTRLRTLIEREHFDSIVCDFLVPAPNFPRLEDCVIFQHNVETMIWRRHAETASNPLKRAYLQSQASKMFRYERQACRAARHVIGVSEADAAMMRSLFGLDQVSHVGTGVDIEYFAPKPTAPAGDLVFVGSMDWLPNIDGMKYFVEQILPLIRQKRPGCSLAIVGRNPPAEVRDWAGRYPSIHITGTVPDVRPYLWGSAISIVPLRIGGGTRLKIFESMAARTAVVSTTIGAEGLEIHPPNDILIADTPAAFAAACLELLANEEQRRTIADEAWNLVSSRFSWARIARDFEQILEAHRISRPASSLTRGA